MMQQLDYPISIPSGTIKSPFESICEMIEEKFQISGTTKVSRDEVFTGHRYSILLVRLKVLMFS